MTETMLSANAEQLFIAAMNLADNDRRLLGERLLDSVESTMDEVGLLPGEMQEQVNGAWRTEILRREAEMDRGENVGAPLDETVQRLIEKYS